MILYKYLITKKEDGYTYTSDAIDTTDPTASGLEELIGNLNFDRPIRMNIVGENKIVWLFDNELAFLAFEAGVFMRHNIDSEFEALANKTAEDVQRDLPLIGEQDE